MLQRFPVESKGRRKKLQEVHCALCLSLTVSLSEFILSKCDLVYIL